MSFHEVQFPTDVSYGSRGGPGWNTAILEQDSGAEQRISRWDAPRHRYDAAYGIKKLSQVYAVKKFAMARNGAAYGFRYKDFSDYASTADGRTIAVGGAADVNHQDVTIGTGDGVKTQFQLFKEYVSGPTTRVRNVTKPVAGTTKVAFSTTEQTSGWTVDTTTGVVTFTTPPAAATIVRAGFEFDVPCRFGEGVDDVLSISIDSYDEGSIDVLEVLEIVDEAGSDEEFYYGGAMRYGTMTTNLTIALANGRVQSFSPTSVGLKLFLPSADSLPGGGPYLYVLNEGSQSVDLRTSADVLVKAIPTSTQVTVILTVGATGAKTWYAF